MRDLDLIQEGLPRLEVDAWGVASLGDQVGTRLHDQAVALLPEARSVLVMAMEIFPVFVQARCRGGWPVNHRTSQPAGHPGGRPAGQPGPRPDRC